MSMNFHGTLHMGSENVDYQMEKARKRPHRQRVAAIFLIGLAVVVVTFGVAPSGPNVDATVTGYGTSASGEPQVSLQYTSPTSGQVVRTDTALPSGWSAEDHPVGSSVGVIATTDDVGGPIAEFPRAHVVMGILLGLLALAGAVALLAAARRNARTPPSPDRRDYRLFPGPGMGRRPTR